MSASDPSSIEYWQSAIQLFQPALIRLLDQLRGQLAEAGWQAKYETREIWPNPPFSPDKLPSEEDAETAPQILYLVHLTRSSALPAAETGEPEQAEPSHATKQVTYPVNLWELCYQICFKDYQPQVERDYIADFLPGQVHPDTRLLDASGEVDWHALDSKTHDVVAQLLQTLSPN